MPVFHTKCLYISISCGTFICEIVAWHNVLTIFSCFLRFLDNSFRPILDGRQFERGCWHCQKDYRYPTECSPWESTDFWGLFANFLCNVLSRFWNFAKSIFWTLPSQGGPIAKFFFLNGVHRDSQMTDLRSDYLCGHRSQKINKPIQGASGLVGRASLIRKFWKRGLGQVDHFDFWTWAYHKVFGSKFTIFGQHFLKTGKTNLIWNLSPHEILVSTHRREIFTSYFQKESKNGYVPKISSFWFSIFL